MIRIRNKQLQNRNVEGYNAFWDSISSNGKHHYHELIEGVSGSTVRINDSELVNLSSYNYLDLVGDPRIDEASIEAIRKYGTGTGGVRAVSGTKPIHRELEERLAEFYGTENALVFGTGFQTNFSVISGIASKGDLILVDRYAHQSIQDGCKFSGADVRRFGHNNMDELFSLLQEQNGYNNRFICVDGVYSMHGDVTDLPKILELGDRFNAITYIDEAHSLGVLGCNGKGTAESFGLEGKIDITMGTLSKTIASIGGFVCSSNELIHMLSYWSHGYLFSASLPADKVASALASLDIIEQEPERVEKLRSNIDHFVDGLKQYGYDIEGESAIIPVITEADKVMEIVDTCFQNGVFVHGFKYPIVQKDLGLLRCCVTSGHTKEDLDLAIELIGSNL